MLKIKCICKWSYTFAPPALRLIYFYIFPPQQIPRGNLCYIVKEFLFEYGSIFTVLSLKPPLTLNCLGVVHCKLVKWLLLYPLYAQLYVTDYTFSENAFCSIQIRNNEENFVHIFAYIRITCKCLKVRQWKASIFQS